MAAAGRNQHNASSSHLSSLDPPALEESTSSDTGEEDEDEEEEEEESIAATRPRREPRAPTSLYIAPTELRKRKPLVEHNDTDAKNKRRRLRRQQLRELERQQVEDALLAEAEQDDEPDNGGRDAFMSARPAKRPLRRKSLFGARRRPRRSGASQYGEDEAEEEYGDRDSADTQSDDERRADQEEREERAEAESEEEGRSERRSSSSEPRIVIHLHVRLKPGRDAGGKFCGIRKYRVDRFSGLPDDMQLTLRQQHKHAEPTPQRNGHEEAHTDDDSDSNHKHAQRSHPASSSHTALRRPRRSRHAESNKQLQSPRSSSTTDGHHARADADELQVKLEQMEDNDTSMATRDGVTRQRTSSATASASAAAPPPATARTAYAQHSLTSAYNSHSGDFSSRFDPSPMSPSRYSFDRTDAAGNFIAPPPPATFPPSPPPSPPASPRIMQTMRSMPSLEFDIANVRAGIHPLYLSALEQVDYMRTERQHGVERLKRERLQHVDDLYTAEMKQVEEEWKDEARGVQQRIIDQLTAQHRQSTHPAHSPSASAAARTTRRRHQLLSGGSATSRAVLKRYHAEYCLPAVERRADLERCRQLIEEVMGEEEGGKKLRRLDERLEKRRERAGAWKRHHNRELDALQIGRQDALTLRQRSANGRFQ